MCCLLVRLGFVISRDGATSAFEGVVVTQSDFGSRIGEIDAYERADRFFV
jgi:hypothetical protein